MESKVSDLKEYRKKKKRKKRVKQTFLSIVIIAMAVTAYSFRDRWIPWLEDTLDNLKYEVFHSSNDNNKNFPVNLMSSSEYKGQVIDNKIAIVTDTYYNVYDDDGSICFSDQHIMSNPVLKTRGKKALIYDQGAKRFIVESRYKTVYTKKTDENIMYANISDKGYVAVVTTSDKYASFLTVYDEKGKVMFYTSSSEKIISLDFTKGSKGCIVSTISSSAGNLVTKLTKYDFSVEKKIWTSKGIDTLGISVNITGDNKCVLVGDSKAVYLDSSGKITSIYSYDSAIKAYSVSGDKLALYLYNEDLRKDTIKIISNGKEVAGIDLLTDVNTICLKGSSLFVVSENNLIKYSTKGTLLRKMSLSAYYDQLLVLKEDAYLLGHEILDKIYVGT